MLEEERVGGGRPRLVGRICQRRGGEFVSIASALVSPDLGSLSTKQRREACFIQSCVQK